MADEKLVCYLCGEEITDDNYTEINGEIYCEKCVKENFTICDDCGEYVSNDDIVEVANGDSVCSDCLCNDYIMCEDCNEYVLNNEAVYLNSYDRYVCISCLDSNYVTCNECGEYVHERDMYRSEDGDVYCEDCYNENFYHCSDCGCEIWHEDVCWHDDEPYCSDCVPSDDEDDEDGVIYSYHNSNVRYVPRFHNNDDERNHSLDLYGLELEVCGRCSYASGFQDIIGSNAVLMYDSSVDGFEMVSMPMTREYFYKDFVPILQKGMKYLEDNGFRGHNRGGIHVHFRELADSMQVANMGLIMYGDETDRRIWKRITQRKSENMHWCSMETTTQSVETIINRNLKTPHGEYNYHGTALNYDTRTCTHELRIFNSNLRVERILKNMECVFALQDYIGGVSEPICDTRGFLLFVDSHASDYPHLVNFLHEKRILDYASKLYGDTYTSSPTGKTLNIDVEDTNRELAVA